MTYTKAELLQMISQMQGASNAFYLYATRIGCHPFIEFTGLMNEYIGMCQNALVQGQDFTETSIHGSGQPLPMKEHNRQYLTEKLECIYGYSLEAITGSPKGVDESG